MHFEQLAGLAAAAPYNAEAKALWKKWSMLWLEKLREAMNLDPKEYKILFNAGGIAIPGEAILNGPDVAVYFTGGFNGIGYARGVKSVKDRTGAQNRWISNQCTFYNALGTIERALAQARDDGLTYPSAETVREEADRLTDCEP